MKTINANKSSIVDLFNNISTNTQNFPLLKKKENIFPRSFNKTTSFHLKPSNSFKFQADNPDFYNDTEQNQIEANKTYNEESETKKTIENLEKWTIKLEHSKSTYYKFNKNINLKES